MTHRNRIRLSKLSIGLIAALAAAPVFAQSTSAGVGGLVTDNGGHIVDVRGLGITNPQDLEMRINQWPGVVTVGIFAQQRAKVCLLGTAAGVKTLTF